MEITLDQLPPEVQQLIAEIQRIDRPLTITDAGIPLAVLSPVRKPKRAPFGCLKNTLRLHDDLIAPAVPESEWEILR